MLKMISRTRTNLNSIVTIILLFGITLFLFSFTPKNISIEKVTLSENNDLVIGEIIWKGNSRYTSEELNTYMGLKSGMPFDEDAIKTKMLMMADGSDLSSLYMNQGYLFFNIAMQHTQENGQVSVSFEVYEGNIIHVQNVRTKGNKAVATDDIMDLIKIQSGDVFNRSKVIEAQHALINSGWFAADKIFVSPLPNPETNTVDLEFLVTER